MQQPKGKALVPLQMSRSREVWRRVTDEHAVLLVSPQVVPDVSWPFSVGLLWLRCRQLFIIMWVFDGKVSKPAGFQQKCSSAIRYGSAGTEYSTLTLDSASDGGLTQWLPGGLSF